MDTNIGDSLDDDHDSNIIHEESRIESKKFHSPLKVRSCGRPPTKRKQSKIEQIEKRAKAKSRKKGSTIDREQDDDDSVLIESQRLFRLDKELLVPNDIVQVSSLIQKAKKFVDEMMDLVELDNLKDAIVGLPGITGLSTEQRNRLSITVELVANPSIIFMDEPTSGLDARAATIGMRTVRNTVGTGRTVVCTIHQPSIDVFEAFDDIL
ncbi:hypothetical protein ZIOFF_008008 [Zingiber officinale]|uniref:ABC transporter domain-containing protein n=1 Tax=Zingiber officinale TaxID=94328 RepID=A0A8J5IHH9_ZINOF|nr:hypothetical protein ZIOFF_008008 [Zingiber officinale]